MRKLPANEKRSAYVLVAFRPIEHEAVKRRAAERGSTVSSTIRQVVLKELFEQANRKAQEAVSSR